MGTRAPQQAPGSTDRLPILEVTRVGRLVRISALDPGTLIEVVAYGPARGEAALERLALAKLARAIQRSRGREARI